MPRIDVDREIKFISTANTQIKFYNKKTPADVVDKIAQLLGILGLEVTRKHLASSSKSITRLDTYFDDGWQLANQACSLNIRSYEGQDIQGGCAALQI